MPSESAAIEMRPPSSTRMASMNPSPSLPSRFSAGTKQSSKISSAVSLARRPSLFSFFPGRNPLASLLHHERGKSVRVRRAIGHRQHDDHVGIVAVGDESLGAVEHPSALRPRRRHARAARIRPRRGLGQSPCADVLAGGQLRNVLFLLRLVARQDKCGSSKATYAPPR